ncbi:MAG: tRNA uridine-5-carboxymethylaminomethyl(34) synthesis GTPase MnmE [Thermodesulfobacteriota bacterium]
MEEDTITAIATPFGESGIGIVRISGSLAEPIAKRLFKPKKDQSYFLSHHFHYGEIIDPQNGNPIDEVLIVLMKSPKTYTREDIVEIQCHGGYFILQKVLELVLREGARMAHPGEFTKRAFINGRIDLTQAEAVIDLIRAKTIASLEIANQQLRGWLCREMTNLKERLIEHLSLIEAHIDFPEEEIAPISLEKMKQELEAEIQKLVEWLASHEEGRIFREGISCAIIGKTNAGKSSLLNVLLKEERAIVTPIPGTTRDVIEEVLNIYGIPVRLMDTAGLRKAKDFIEQEGMRRAKERVVDSDFVLLMLDGSRPLDTDDMEIFEEVKRKKKVVILNKNDLPLNISLEEVKRRFQEDPVVSISCLRNEGIDDLKRAIYSSLIHRDVRATPEHMILANVRHKTALSQAKDSLSNAVRGLEEGTSLEFIAFEIRSALEALGEVIGETTTEEVLNRIFEQFCIGK